jgi:hypothetical protein
VVKAATRPSVVSCLVLDHAPRHARLAVVAPSLARPPLFVLSRLGGDLHSRVTLSIMGPVGRFLIPASSSFTDRDAVGTVRSVECSHEATWSMSSTSVGSPTPSYLAQGAVGRPHVVVSSSARAGGPPRYCLAVDGSLMVYTSRCPSGVVHQHRLVRSSRLPATTVEVDRSWWSLLLFIALSLRGALLQDQDRGLGSSARDVAKQLRDYQMVMKGHRDSALIHTLRMRMFRLPHREDFTLESRPRTTIWQKFDGRSFTSVTIVVYSSASPARFESSCGEGGSFDNVRVVSRARLESSHGSCGTVDGSSNVSS